MTFRSFLYNESGTFIMFAVLSAVGAPILFLGVLEIPYIDWLIAVMPDHLIDAAGFIATITIMIAAAAPFAFAALYGKEDEDDGAGGMGPASKSPPCSKPDYAFTLSVHSSVHSNNKTNPPAAPKKHETDSYQDIL